MMMSASIFRLQISQKIVSRICHTSVRELHKPSPPSLMMAPYFPSSEVVYRMFSPLPSTHGKVVEYKNGRGKEEADLMQDKETTLVGASHGWLALLNHRSRNMCLSNPISGVRVKLPRYPSSLDKEADLSKLKVIISHPARHKRCRALMILDSQDRVFFCKPNCEEGKEEWTPFGRTHDEKDHPKIIYSDLVYSPTIKRFCGVVRSEAEAEDEVNIWGDPSMERWGLQPRMDLHHTVRAPHRDSKFATWHSYLVYVNKSRKLYLVRRYAIDRESVDYNVYTVDLKDRGVKLCSSLGGLAFFVGINHSFAVEAKDPFKANSIYFGGVWYDDTQRIDHFDYDTKAYSSPCFNILQPPNEKFPFHSPMAWFRPSD